MKPLLLFFAAITAFAQTNGSAIPFVKSQWFTAGGLPAATQKLCFYLAGTSTPSAPFTTSAIHVATANPVVLDSAGRADIFLGTISYKIVMLTAASTTTDCTTGTMSILWTEDNIANNADLLRVALARSTGAGLVGYQPIGADATTGATTVSSLLDRMGFILNSNTYTAPGLFTNACSAASGAGKNLMVDSTVTTLVANATYACDLFFTRGGKLQIPTGVNTFSGNVYCPPSQTCFDTSTNSGASVVFTGTTNTNGNQQTSLTEFKHFYAGGAAPATTTTGTDTAAIAGTLWISEIFLPAHISAVTGISYLVGSVGAADKVMVALFDSAGNILANSALDSSVTVGTAATFQRVPFTAPLAVAGPGKYFVGVSFNGTTAKIRTQAFGDTSTTSIAQTFNTLVAITPPTSFTASVGPYCMTY